MATEFTLPSIGEGIDSADIAEILVSEGDTVAEGDILMELETDKAVVELPSGVAGTITKLLVSEGDTINVGQAVMTVEGGGDAAGGGQDSAEEPQAEEPAAAADAETTAPTEAAAKPADQGGGVAAGDGVEEANAGAGGGGPFTFELPSIGEGIETADVAEVLVSVGDELEKDAIVAELETDKAVVELPLSRAGTVTEVLIAAGDTITVGQPVLKLEGAAGAASEAAPPKKSEPAATPSPADPPSKSAAPSPAEGATRSLSKPDATTTAVAVASNGQSNGRPDGVQDKDRRPAPAAPSTRRFARELGVDLYAVSGSGPGGRITQEDVQAFVKNRMTQSPSNLPAAVGANSVGGGGVQLALAPPPLPDFSAFGEVSREKLNKMSRTAAENLLTAWHVIPHVTQQDEADITDLEAARKQFGAGAGKDGPKVTMTAIAMKALAACLREFPKFNSSLDPETMEIVHKHFINIGCAVDTPNGLVVPVVRDCDQKSILEIAEDVTNLAIAARDRKLQMSDMQGATCTITNLGGIGGTGFTPIVNYPEVAILGMSRGRKVPQLQDGKLVERLMLPLSLSYDHRVINGADAARFVVMFKGLLSDPFGLMAMA